MYCVLSITVHHIEYLVRMSDLLELIDILDGNEILHSTDSTYGVGSRTFGVASHVTSSSWVPFTGLFFVIC